MLSSLYGGWKPGILCVVLAGLATKYFFLPPLYSLAFTTPNTIFRFTVLLLVALMICGLSAALRRERQHNRVSLERLKASEAKFRRLADANIIGVISAHTRGGITEANDAFLKMVGYTREDLLAGRVRWDEMTPPDFHSLDEIALAELIEKGTHPPYEKEYIHKQGHRVPILVGSALLDDNSRENTISFILDLSDVYDELRLRKRSEQRQLIQYAIARVLAEATTLTNAVPTILQSLCESLGWQLSIMWIVDAQANVLRYVESWHTPHVNVEEFLEANYLTTFTAGVGFPGRIWASRQPMWVSNLVEDDNFPRVASASRGGLRGAFGFPIRVDDEILGVIECFSDKIQEPDADLLQMMASIGSQIGQFMERKRAEEKLTESRQLFVSFMNHSPARAYIKDEAGRYVYVNAKLERDFNRPLADWLGKTDFDFMPAEIAQQWRDNDLAVLTSNQPIESIEKILQDDGEHYWMAFKFPLEDASGQRFVAGKSFDISDRKRAEEQIAALNRDLNRRINDFQTLLEVIPVGIGIALDPECRDIRINPAFAEWLNISKEVNASTSQPNAEQLPYKVYRHGRELPPQEQPIQYAATHGVVVRNVDLDIVHQDGITLHLVGNAAPLFDEDGQIRGCVGAFLDISDVSEELRLRKQTEAALRTSENLYRTLSEAVPAFIGSCDAEGRTD
ncbi:MAG TPA: PAS domain S-box protein, partial [Cyanophyceae cyanobacterium]